MAKNADLEDVKFRSVRFAELLASSGLTVAEFAEWLGLREATVRRWGEKVPQYALAYLELARDNRACLEEIDRLRGEFNRVRP